MTDNDNITEQQLNAFVDNQLDHTERARVLESLATDKSQAEELAQMQQLNDLIRLAYTDTDIPLRTINIIPWYSKPGFAAIAATLTLSIGIITGWIMHQDTGTNSVMTNLSQLNPQHPGHSKILIHINNMDQQKIDNALREAEKLMDSAVQDGKELQVEILANAEGLGMFRDQSPYAKRISSLANKHPNMAFRACGFAIAHAKLKEQRDIKLVPEAQPVDAALEEILRRMKAGWLYVRA